ncbi:hypothetical protein AURDEDRAFT_173061 [Auricularia subglabra TFB-10046 SS5]|uniref:Uncharacterized protein n=1 Tax=Auricularia subglabra (strain TFB-10046 / SS5) TaxID=717982 RepID=J0WV32_AURST|nr:hypothetical protein AURDEDRAFT_173061 [Auricularia subglabra TFB-10046 SS5]
MAGVLAFLQQTHRDDPRRLLCHVDDPSACLSWFLREIRTTGIVYLHFTELGCLRNVVDVAATAISAAGDMRSSVFSITSLVSFNRFDTSDCFATLRELSIGEALWPTGPYPELPLLHKLVIALGDYSPYGRNFAPSIFLLPLATGHAWTLPALRTLHIAYQEEFAREDNPRGPPWGTPLVVSAAEILLFILWNLHTDVAPTLFLQNVLLFEPPGSLWRHRLDCLVQQPGVVLEEGYLPIESDTSDLFTSARVEE